MQTTEVTLKQWRTLMGKKLFGRRKGTANHPVTKVSWYDCQDFIAKLNALNEGVYRLPTEAEWEYACQAGTTTAYSWREKADCSRAMYANNAVKAHECFDYVKTRHKAVNQAAPVKSYPPNAWGLYDMHGNVWEWCLDCYVQDYDLNDNSLPVRRFKSLSAKQTEVCTPALKAEQLFDLYSQP
jgi:formylglycine-generating enzyme required for sulfatase activity